MFFKVCNVTAACVNESYCDTGCVHIRCPSAPNDLIASFLDEKICIKLYNNT